MRKKKEEVVFSRRSLGVFELRVCDTVCAYFVGWRFRWVGRARNIRAGLYFSTAEEAINFRDNIENNRKWVIDEHNQIA